MSTTPDDIRLTGLQDKKVAGLPPAGYYIRNFISEEEEDYLLRHISETPQPKWKKYWGGTLSKNGVLLPEPMPEWLTARGINERIDSFLDDAAGSKGVLGINQVLINEYEPGQGISPHEDGPAFTPLVSTLSLGSPTVLDLHHYVSFDAPSPPMIPTSGDEGGRAIAAVPLGHVLLERRSLFVLTGSLYGSHLHGIAAKTEDWVKAPSSSSPTPTATTSTTATSDPPSSLASRTEAADGEDKIGNEETQKAGEGRSGRGEEEEARGETAGETRPGSPDIIANVSLLDPATAAKCQSKDGYRYIRDTRVSLTFRHAKKALKGGKFSMLAGGLRRT